MNIFSISSLSVAVTCVILFFIILIYGKTKLHRTWALFNIVVATWGLGCFIAGNTSTPEAALIGWQIALSGGVFISVVFYHTVCIFCDIKKKLS